MFKKLICIVTSLVIIFSFASCKSNNTESDNGKPTIVATIFPLYDFAKSIVGDKMNVELLVQPGNSSHDFANNVSMSDIKKVSSSDMFLYCGGESDQWLEDGDVFKSLDKNSTVCAMDLVKTYDEELVDGMQEVEEESDKDEKEENLKEIDEHVWTDPQNAVLISKKICDIAKKIDADNADYYESNSKTYCEKLNKLDKQFENMVSSAKRKVILVADRFPFRYLAEAYNLEYYAAFPGCSSTSDVSVKTLAFLVNKVNSEKLPVIFYTDGSTKTVCNQVASETGVKQLLLHSCHDITKAEFSSGATYLSIMQQNLTNLTEALN